MKTCSIIGCGWLGFPVAKRLLLNGFHLKGSTTSASKVDLLQEAGIESFLLKIQGDQIEGDQGSFFDSEYAIISIPPGRRNPANIQSYSKSILKIASLFKSAKLQQLIFISSTSVYGSIAAEVQEDSELLAQTDSAKAIVSSEKQLRGLLGNKLTILRMAGLSGPSRNPARFLAGRKGIKGRNHPVNLVHLEDCIRVIELLFSKNISGKSYNVVSDEHPSKEEFYTYAAEKLGLLAPGFDQEDHTMGKLVRNDLLKKELNFKFSYPSPFNMLD